MKLEIDGQDRSKYRIHSATSITFGCFGCELQLLGSISFTNKLEIRNFLNVNKMMLVFTRDVSIARDQLSRPESRDSCVARRLVHGITCHHQASSGRQQSTINTKNKVKFWSERKSREGRASLMTKRYRNNLDHKEFRFCFLFNRPKLRHFPQATRTPQHKINNGKTLLRHHSHHLQVETARFASRFAHTTSFRKHNWTAETL